MGVTRDLLTLFGVINRKLTTQEMDNNLITLADAVDASSVQVAAWNPVLGMGVTGQTYNTRVGRATKIGDRCFANFYIELTAKGNAGGGDLVTLSGLPWTAANSAPVVGGGTITYFSGLGANWLNLFVSVFSNQSCYLQGMKAAGSQHSYLSFAADITNTTIIAGTIEYQAQ